MIVKLRYLLFYVRFDILCTKNVVWTVSLENQIYVYINVIWNGSRCNATLEYWVGFAVK